MGQAYTEIDVMKRRPSDNYDFYYHFAIGSMLVSALTVVILAVSIPLLCSRVTRDRDVIATKSDKFREDTNRLWSNIQLMQNGRLPDSGAGGALPPVTFFSRKQRSPWSKQICSGCSPLSCPSGGPGLPGPPGDDGAPGTTGNPGKAGEDGYDVELEPEDDLPCAICPGGPPGQRGLQGERGQAGSPGLSGEQGPPGTPGIDGPPGNTGPPGPLGGRGQPGSSGPPGDQVIAGVGIKGPRGAPGPAGPKGPMGQAGKASKGVGFPGKPGPIGPPGQAGLSGRPGDEGPWGPPGEPGQPSAYCPSDCGVSQILAPALRPEASTSYGNEKQPRVPPPSAPTSYGGESSPTQSVAASNDDYPQEVAPSDLNEHNAALRYYYRQRAAMMA